MIFPIFDRQPITGLNNYETFITLTFALWEANILTSLFHFCMAESYLEFEPTRKKTHTYEILANR